MNKLIGVAGKAVVRKNGKILLLQRHLGTGFDPGLWELPGGKIDPGEDLVEALSREIREEVGLAVTVGRPFKTWHFVKDPFWVTGVTFVCDYVGGEVRLSREHNAYEWIEPAGYSRFPLATAVEEQIRSYLDLVKGKP